MKKLSSTALFIVEGTMNKKNGPAFLIFTGFIRTEKVKVNEQRDNRQLVFPFTGTIIETGKGKKSRTTKVYGDLTIMTGGEFGVAIRMRMPNGKGKDYHIFGGNEALGTAKPKGKECSRFSGSLTEIKNDKSKSIGDAKLRIRFMGYEEEKKDNEINKLAGLLSL